MFTDTHCHLYKEYYDDIDSIINDSINNKVNRWINNGCDKKTNEEVIELARKYKNMYAAIGIHPEYVDSYTEADIQYIEDNIDNIIAIGEIGLDYHYTKDNKDEQIILLETQLKLAEKYNIPVIIHSRDATLDTINILKKYKVVGTIHSFSGSLEIANEYIKMGYLIGINGVVTFKNAKLKEVVEKLPLDSIVFETDSPYLTPEPYRGRQNNPSYIMDIATFVASIKKVSVTELASITNDNINRLYKIN